MTTQNADQLLIGVNNHIQSIQYDVNLALRYINNHLATTSGVTTDSILHMNDLPTLSSVYVLDVILAKVQVVLDNYTTKSAVIIYSSGIETDLLFYLKCGSINNSSV